MFAVRALRLAFLAHLVSGHFELQYPHWRGNSFLLPASQWIYPSANINQSDVTNNNRTMWPLDGGSIVIDFHHPFTYVWMNLGLGEVIAAFNYSLTPMPLNETGNGTICIPKFPIPAEFNITDGTDASLQVVTVGDSGSALYNCADITFSSNATILSGDQCRNTTGLSLEPLLQQENRTLAGSSSSSATPSSTESSSASESSSFANMNAPSYMALLAGLISIALAS